MWSEFSFPPEALPQGLQFFPPFLKWVSTDLRSKWGSLERTVDMLALVWAGLA
jgi:hypothetical protein